MGKYQKYDYRVQLMRIIACLIVIGCHIRLNPVIGDSFHSFSFFLHSFCDDGVAIFFALAGFYIVVKDDEKPIWKVIGKSFIRILAPVLFFMLIITFLDRWINAEAGIGECFANPQLDFSVIKLSFLRLNWGYDSAWGHLWYVTTYLQIIMTLPLLRLLTLEHPYAKKAGIWFLTINILAAALGDVRVFFPGWLRDLGIYEIVGRAYTYVVLGYYVYSKRDLIAKHRKKVMAISLAIMLAVNLLRVVLQNILYSHDAGNTYFYKWTTGISLIFTVCFLCFFLAFPQIEGTKKGVTVINLIGSVVYFIYISHKAVLAAFNSRGLHYSLYSPVIEVTESRKLLILYYATYPLLIFLISLVICILPSIGFDLLMGIRFKNRKRAN